MFYCQRKFFSSFILLITIVNILGQGKFIELIQQIQIRNQILLDSCQDFQADPTDCRKFIRCFNNVQIKFTCPLGAAWESSLKTCVAIESVDSCKKVQERRFCKWNIFCLFLIMKKIDSFFLKLKI